MKSWIIRPADLPQDDFDSKEGLQAAIAWRRKIWEKAFRKKDGYELSGTGETIDVIRHETDVLGKNVLQFVVQPFELSREAADLVNETSPMPRAGREPHGSS